LARSLLLVSSILSASLRKPTRLALTACARYEPLITLSKLSYLIASLYYQVEIKHGRISMLAVLGHITTTGGVHFPGNVDMSGLKFSDVPDGLAAFGVLPAAGIAQIFAFIAFLEIGVMQDFAGTAEFVGDFRNGFVGGAWDTLDEETKISKRAIELNNGRAAQMGILALMVHEKLNNDPYIINTLLGSPVPFNA
jgi:hypothetical protein